MKKPSIPLLAGGVILVAVVCLTAAVGVYYKPWQAANVLPGAQDIANKPVVPTVKPPAIIDSLWGVVNTIEGSSIKFASALRSDTEPSAFTYGAPMTIETTNSTKVFRVAEIKSADGTITEKTLPAALSDLKQNTFIKITTVGDATQPPLVAKEIRYWVKAPKLVPSAQ